MSVDYALPFTEATLNNGLQILVSEDHRLPCATVYLWYKVGSQDEPPGRTGLAHLLEHLMFSGSRQVADGEHGSLLNSVGATFNGNTSYGRTVFFQTVPTGAVETAMWLEADRMATLGERLNNAKLDRERGVVEAERRQRYDRVPYGSLYEHLIPNLLPAWHPHGHTPIGSRADIDAIGLSDVIEFWERWYGPNNAILAVVGDIRAAEAIAMADHYFGSIAPIRMTEATPVGSLAPLDGPIEVDVNESVPAERLIHAWRIPPVDTEVADALHLAATMLATGNASRLATGHGSTSISHASAAIGRMAQGANWFITQLTARPGHPLSELELLLRGELASIARHGPSETELSRAKAHVQQAMYRWVGTQTGRAGLLSSFAANHDDPGLVNTFVTRRLSPTCNDIRTSVAEYLMPHRSLRLRYLQDARPQGESR